MQHGGSCPQISSVVGDFPLVHPAMYGKPTRYAYTAITDTKDDAAQVKVRVCTHQQTY
jgi:carotenoid cleavage dioxygenase-like enzyme